jgi:hypothetical protein
MFGFGEGSGGWEQYIFIIVIVLLLVWTMTRRKKQSSGNINIDAVGGVLGNVNENLRVLDERMTNWQSKKKFQTRAWNTYKDRLTFLDSSLTSSINESFTLAEDLNTRIDSAKKNKAMATLQDMPLEKLREPLTKSRDGLTTWLRTNFQAETQNSQRSGCGGF